MTTEQNWLSNKYLLYRFLVGLGFAGAIWLYFYRIFITDQQLGILDGLAFAIGLLAEVPTGALADKFGKDKILRLGLVLVGSGLLVNVFGSSFMPFFLGQTVVMIGTAFVSGADEALFFERLDFSRNSKNWRKLVTRGSQVALIAALIATLIGGLLYSVSPRLPWLLNALAFIIAAGAVWNIKDTRQRAKKQKFLLEISHYLKDIKTGFEQFRKPKLRLYVPYIIAVQGLFYTTSGDGLLRVILLSRFTFSPFVGSVAIASSSLITVGLLAYMHKNADNLSEKKVLTITGLVAASGLFLSIAHVGLWGFAIILALYAGGHVLRPFMSEVLNYRINDSQRATILSVATFLKILPYVVLAPIIGYLSSSHKLEYFFITWGIIMLVSTTLYLVAKKRDTHIKLSD